MTIAAAAAPAGASMSVFSRTDNAAVAAVATIIAAVAAVAAIIAAVAAVATIIAAVAAVALQ